MLPPSAFHIPDVKVLEALKLSKDGNPLRIVCKAPDDKQDKVEVVNTSKHTGGENSPCLLYTSDAADE